MRVIRSVGLITIMNKEEILSRRRELYRLKRERETTEEREERLARQRDYMRCRRAVLTEQQRDVRTAKRDNIISKKTKLLCSLILEFS